MATGKPHAKKTWLVDFKKEAVGRPIKLNWVEKMERDARIKAAVRGLEHQKEMDRLDREREWHRKGI